MHKRLLAIFKCVVLLMQPAPQRLGPCVPFTKNAQLWQTTRHDKPRPRALQGSHAQSTQHINAAPGPSRYQWLHTLPPGLSRTQGGESTSGSRAMTASCALRSRLITPRGSCVMLSVKYLWVYVDGATSGV
jgi:hypothetical protein